MHKCTGGNDCCSKSNLCGICEGDCDQDDDCSSGLKCGLRNCVNTTGTAFDESDDCCYKPIQGIIAFVLFSTISINYLGLAK